MEKMHQDIHDLVEKLGYELYEIVYEKREEGQVLCVRIDNITGIDIDDCVKVSEAVSDYLDETDPIAESYSLEVTSAGAERELRTYEEISRSEGKFVHVETLEQQFDGILENVTHTSVTIHEKNNKTSTILMADIELIRLAIDF